MIYQHMTDDVWGISEKYKSFEFLFSPYQRDWLSAHRNEFEIKTKDIDELFEKDERAEGHLWVIELYKVNKQILGELNSILPGLSWWLNSVEKVMGMSAELVIFNQLTQQVLAVALGPECEVVTYNVLEKVPVKLVSLYCECCVHGLDAGDLQFSYAFSKHDYFGVIPYLVDCIYKIK